MYIEHFSIFYYASFSIRKNAIQWYNIPYPRVLVKISSQHANFLKNNNFYD